MIAAWGILVWQTISLYLLLRDRITDGDANLEGRLSLSMFYAGVIAIALAGTVVLSSPYRRSLAERLFSLVWLGRFGRAVLRAVGGAPRGTSNTAPQPRHAALPTPPRVPPVQPNAASAPSLEAIAADVAALGARVAALESRER
ncbi:MAG: hypothetical protein U5K74_08730 [Gemmatimonadaceae bacterium]|nr:hypothetical protein [Gemmatimonadaceae bacterium]